MRKKLVTNSKHQGNRVTKQGTRVASAMFRVQVLTCIKKGMYASQIARKLKCSRRKVHYHLKILEKSGAVIRQADTKPIFYTLGPGITRKMEVLKPLVTKNLIGHEKNASQKMDEIKELMSPTIEVNSHSIKIRLEVLKGQLPLLPETYQMNNWLRSTTTKLFDGLPIRLFLNHTKSPNITIQAPAMYGKSAVENEARYLVLGEKVRAYYMQRIPGLELDKPVLSDKDHQIDEPVIASKLDEGRFSVNGVYADGTPTPGIESHKAVSIDDYLRLPSLVKDLQAENRLLHQKIDVLKDTIKELILTHKNETRSESVASTATPGGPSHNSEFSGGMMYS